MPPSPPAEAERWKAKLHRRSDAYRSAPLRSFPNSAPPISRLDVPRVRAATGETRDRHGRCFRLSRVGDQPLPTGAMLIVFYLVSGMARRELWRTNHFLFVACKGNQAQARCPGSLAGITLSPD